MDFCIKCNEDADKGGTSVQCNYCQKWQHKECFPNPNRDFKAAQKSVWWFCSPQCQQGYGVSDSMLRINADSQDPKDLMAMFIGMFNIMQDNKMVLIKHINENAQLKEEVNLMKKHQSKYEARIEELTNEVGKLKQQQVNNKAICFGLRDKDELLSIKINVIRHLESADIITGDVNIKDAYTIPQKDKNKPKPIICIFDTSDDKLKFIKSIRDARKNVNKNKNLKIFAFEVLTKESKQLFEEAKIVFEGYKHIWTKNGQVFVRESNESTVIKINSSQDFAPFIKK